MSSFAFTVRLEASLLSVSLLGACALHSKPPELMYRLQAHPSATQVSMADSHQGPARIRVMPLRANRPQGGSLGIFVAQVGPVVRVESFADGRWEEPPETVIERALIAALGDSASDGAMSGAQQSAVTALRLQWSLDQFELVESPGDDPSRIKVAIRFRLLASQPPGLVAAGMLREQEGVAMGAPVEAVVLAFNRATSRVLSELIRRLQATIAAMPPARLEQTADAG